MSRGWRYCGKSKFRRDTAPGIEAGLDYNFVLSNNPASARVTPSVEVIHAEVEKIRKIITGHSSYTVSRQIRMLMPPDNYTIMQWVFTERRGVKSVARLLVDDAITHAPTYYEPLTTLGDIVGMLEQRGVSQQTISGQALAISYCLLGEPDKAMAALSQDIERVMNRANEEVRRERLMKYQEIFGLPSSRERICLPKETRCC